MQEAKVEVASLDVATAYRVTKAFAAYFELTNLAETNHRKRRRRGAEVHADEPPLPGSFRGTLARMKQAGVTLEQALAAFGEIEVQPVFTAHPTEITRRAVLLKRGRIARELEKLDRLPLPDSQAQACEDTILGEITALWQTDEVRLQKPTVIDEIRTGLSYYTMTLFETVPKIYEGIAADFREVYGAEVDMVSLPRLRKLRIVDWRRPRRQSLCVAAVHARRTGTGAIAGSVALHRRGRPAGASSHGFLAPGACLGGVARSPAAVRTQHRRAGGGLVANAAGRSLSPPAADGGSSPSLHARSTLPSRRVRIVLRSFRTTWRSSGAACAKAVANGWRAGCSIRCSASCAPSDSACTRSTSGNMPECIAQALAEIAQISAPQPSDELLPQLSATEHRVARHLPHDRRGQAQTTIPRPSRATSSAAQSRKTTSTRSCAWRRCRVCEAAEQRAIRA